MTQMIILDNAQVMRLKLDYARTRVYHSKDLLKLRNAIYNNPNTNRQNTLPYGLITFLAHHHSGRPFIRRLYRSKRKSNSAWMHQIDGALQQLFRLYHEGKISGDLVIHKTSERSGSEFEQWPFIYKRRENYECWFLTGMTQWVDNLNRFAHSTKILPEHYRDPYHDYDSLSYAQRKQRMIKAKLSSQMVNKVRKDNDFFTLYKRAQWVKTIRKYFNPNLWRELIWDGTPRGGMCIYIKGRAYWTQLGKDKCDWYIREHRARVFQPPFSVWLNSDSDDPDFLNHYSKWREHAMNLQEYDDEEDSE